ncbi:Unknown protein [Striga hermonthica]|uniref:Coiled-coil SMC6 And NSE5 INteracting (CANIN) domain-containing protein n=1 Tax=Striga hermonthica TaxID=68872 RepID=A0A9N7MTY2_STRHE|nr:Unknown protein [Striga hermonthica]
MADDSYDPLGFDFEDPISISPPPAKNKKKLIGLDDLLKDYQREQKRLNDNKSKQKNIRKSCDLDDEVDDAAEARLSECVEKCQKEINQINGDEEMPFWGIQVFGEQQKIPQQEHPELKNSVLLQSFWNQKINSLFEINVEKEEEFLEELLVDGWLFHLVSASGHVEESIAKWTFDSILYSSTARLMEAACEFWCAILSVNDKADSSSVKIDWLPSYSDLKIALNAYGFLMDSSSKLSSEVDMVNADSMTAGPPQNIRSWIKFVTSCSQRRDANIIFSTQETEDLVITIISLFLDRQLLGLSIVLHESLLSLINSFQDDEWPASCKKVAKSLAHRLPCNINSLRIVESIVGTDGRSKQLRSVVAFQFLATCLNKKANDAEEILRSLTSINVKDKDCDLFQMYICLNLAENWLLFEPTLKDKAEISKLWNICLRNCSCGISITDLRSYASNVRSKASYLLQGSTSK